MARHLTRLLAAGLLVFLAVAGAIFANFALLGYADSQDDRVGKLRPLAAVTQPRTSPTTTGRTKRETSTETATETETDDRGGRSGNSGHGGGGEDD